ncbi:MAG: hypothetical protein IPL96_13505 [Holophagaceae bacterium]|nr:hypothetical protein [Holophagaceae bacterium]
MGLESALETHGIPGKVYGRSKHLYGIWRKMGAQEKGLEDVHDWLAYRIVCPDRASCYTALGLVHALYRPSPAASRTTSACPRTTATRASTLPCSCPPGTPSKCRSARRTCTSTPRPASRVTGPTRKATSPTAPRSTRWPSCAAWWNCTRIPATAGTWWPT